MAFCAIFIFALISPSSSVTVEVWPDGKMMRSNKPHPRHRDNTMGFIEPDFLDELNVESEEETEVEEKAFHMHQAPGEDERSFFQQSDHFPLNQTVYDETDASNLIESATGEDYGTGIPYWRKPKSTRAILVGNGTMGDLINHAVECGNGGIMAEWKLASQQRRRSETVRYQCIQAEVCKATETFYTNYTADENFGSLQYHSVTCPDHRALHSWRVERIITGQITTKINDTDPKPAEPVRNNDTDPKLDGQVRNDDAEPKLAGQVRSASGCGTNDTDPKPAEPVRNNDTDPKLAGQVRNDDAEPKLAGQVRSASGCGTNDPKQNGQVRIANLLARSELQTKAKVRIAYECCASNDPKLAPSNCKKKVSPLFVGSIKENEVQCPHDDALTSWSLKKAGANQYSFSYECCAPPPFTYVYRSEWILKFEGNDKEAVKYWMGASTIEGLVPAGFQPAPDQAKYKAQGKMLFESILVNVPDCEGRKDRMNYVKPNDNDGQIGVSEIDKYEWKCDSNQLIKQWYMYPKKFSQKCCTVKKPLGRCKTNTVSSGASCGNNFLKCPPTFRCDPGSALQGFGYVRTTAQKIDIQYTCCSYL